MLTDSQQRLYEQMELLSRKICGVSWPERWEFNLWTACISEDALNLIRWNGACETIEINRLVAEVNGWFTGGEFITLDRWKEIYRA